LRPYPLRRDPRERGIPPTDLRDPEQYERYRADVAAAITFRV
jgi:hypothetical protein